MRKRWQRVVAVLALGFAGTWIVVQVMGRKAPGGLGVNNGGLADCPDTPNCVCSDCEGAGQMPPLKYTGEVAAAKLAVKKALQKRGIAIVEETESYLHGVATTPIMRFHDDLEFLIDAENKAIHFRSASRLGKSDLGKNRARLKEIFALLAVENIRPENP